MFENIDNWHPVNLVAGIQTHADRWCNKPDCKSCNHHGAELQGREAEILHNREQNRCQQQNCRRDIDERSDKQDQSYEDQRDRKSGHIQSEEEVRDQLRNALHGQYPCKDRCKSDDDHNRRAGNEALFKRFPHLLPCKLTINKKSDNQ